MRHEIQTVAEQMVWDKGATWYVDRNGGMAHLVGRVNGGENDDDRYMRLCKYQFSGRPHPSVTAPHCQACTRVLKRFHDVAIVEPQSVRETLTITVLRPAGSTKTLIELAQAILDRQQSWEGEIRGHMETPVSTGDVVDQVAP